MKMNLFLVASFIAGLLFTANPVPPKTDGKGAVVVAKSLHFDAAETVWLATLPSLSVAMPTMPCFGRVAVTHPDSKTLAGVQRRPPKKWECKG